MAETITQPLDRNQPVEIPTTPDAVVEESPQTPATEEVTPAPAEETTENSSSTEEDLSALIEAERKQGKPDPEKARQRFLENQGKQEDNEETFDDPEEKPLTRGEIEEIIATERAELVRQANASQIDTLAASLGETPQEAELIKEVHKNRVFPQGMSLSDQLNEAHAIATHKRTQAKAAELARAVQHQQNASRNTATTHRDPQAGTEPQLASDLAASLKRAGFTYDNQNRRYEKKLPNGKTLVRGEDGSRYLAD